MNLSQITESSLAGNALLLALEKPLMIRGKSYSIVGFYNYRRLKWFPNWCDLCFMFWFGVVASLGFGEDEFLQVLFSGLCICFMSCFLRIVYLKLHDKI